MIIRTRTSPGRSGPGPSTGVALPRGWANQALRRPRALPPLAARLAGAGFVIGPTLVYFAGFRMLHLTAPELEAPLALVLTAALAGGSLAFAARTRAAHSLNPGLVVAASLIVFSWFPGAALWNEEWEAARAVLAILGAWRIVVLLWQLPQVASLAPAVTLRHHIGAYLAGGLLTSLVTLVIGYQQGLSVLGGARFVGESVGWLNANMVGLVASSTIVVAATATELSWPVRLAPAAISALALAMAESRASLAAVVGSLALGGVLRTAWGGRASKLRAAGFGVLGVLGVGLLLGPLAGTDRAQSLASRSLLGPVVDVAAASSGRSVIWAEAWHEFLRSPVFGHGIGAPASRFENGPLSVLVEVGTFGAVAMIWFYCVVVARAVRQLRAGAASKEASLPLLTMCLVAFQLIHSLGERTHAFQIASPLSNLFLLLVGHLFLVTPNEKEVGRLRSKAHSVLAVRET